LNGLVEGGAVLDDTQGQDPIDRWCRACEQGDAQAAAACLASQVELVSPLTEQFLFRGRQQVHDLLTVAFTAIDDIQFHTRLRDRATRALFYRARIGSQILEEAQLLRLDDAGLIQEITLFIRPLPALTGLMSALGPKLARQQGRPRLAVFLAASAAPLHALARAGDQRIVPLAAPPSARVSPSRRTIGS
jgi:hypothetical protein